MIGQPVPPALRDWVEIVVSDNADDLLRYFRRRVTQAEDAADLLGRVLLAVWEKSARLPTTDQDARMWCFGIARNILREYYRHSAKQLALADGLRDYLRTSAAAHNGADTVAEKNSRSDAVREALNTLSDHARELLILVHWDGFSIAEAARVLAVNESTARTQHARAMKRLQKQLDTGEEGDTSTYRLNSKPRRRASLADS